MFQSVCGAVFGLGLTLGPAIGSGFFRVSCLNLHICPFINFLDFLFFIKQITSHGWFLFFSLEVSGQCLLDLAVL